LLQLAEELGNVSKACKLIGYHRDTFYEVKRAFQIGGVAALVEQKRGPRNPHPNRVAPDIEKRILDYSLQYPTQAAIATALALSRETPRLHINAVEPGFNPATGLGGADSGAVVRFIQRFVVPLLVPLFMQFMKILTTSKRAGRVLSGLLMDTSGRTGVYLDEGGKPMRGSPQLHDPKFQERVVAETRAFLKAHA
jgi:hypothetical protein